MRSIEILPGNQTVSARFAALARVDERPDARILLRDGDGEEVAHVALWWNDVPPLENDFVGAIGGFFASDEVAASVVLDAAADVLREQGRTIAVGPMNGNTWRRYRFVDGGAGRIPFLLEPSNPVTYPQWWRDAGFADLSWYSSSVLELDGTEVVTQCLKERLARSGVSIRKMNPEQFDDELRLIHQISLRSFPSNFLYTPLAEDEFIESYRKVKGYVDGDFVLIAEKQGVPCGFAFGIPDVVAAARGDKRVLIVKTLAVDPASRSAGLGSWLVDELHREGRTKGYTEAIHALQHQNNTSLKITGRHEGEVFRRYVLFSKRL